jgi:hypothetical protein
LYVPITWFCVIADELASDCRPQILPVPSKKNRPAPGSWPERLFLLLAKPAPFETEPVDPPVEPVAPVLPPVEPLDPVDPVLPDDPPIPVLPVAPPPLLDPLPMPVPELVPPVLPVDPVLPLVFPAAEFNEFNTLWKFRLVTSAL